MSLITRCPACGTMFKVVPDQLRISEGWVRCGHYSEVFDASAHLQGENAAAPVPEPVAASHAAPAGEVPPPNDPHSYEDFDSSLNTNMDEGVVSQVPDSAQLEEEAQAMVEDPLDRPFQLLREDDGDAAAARPAREDGASPDEPSQPSESAAGSQTQPDLHDLSFVRQARRKAFWRRPLVRAMLLLTVIGLGSLLVLQVAVHDRDRLAAAESALHPWLSKLCESLQCAVAAPRQIEAITIDSSSFNKLRGEAYRLNVTLKNQASIHVALPALELTLTDGQDQPLVRRVLLPSEFGSPAGVVAAASEWSGSLVLAVAANGNGGRVAGYRLLAFYP